MEKDFELSTDNTVACKIRPETDDILYSNANSYVCGHTIIFKVY